MTRFLHCLLFFVCIAYCGFAHCSGKRLKVLHLSFHRGCIREFDAVAEYLSLDVESWFIPDLPGQFFDGVTRGNVLYNITHERAECIWNKHKRFFDQFDAILVSDTAPLSRIFLQNDHWNKPLIIWVCNRFDYSDQSQQDGIFPDKEYYEIFETATKKKNVFIIPFAAYEIHYAKKKGIEINNFVVAPCALKSFPLQESCIPSHVVKEETFFLPPYHNEMHFMNLQSFCEVLGIKAYCGRYNGASDVKDFKAFIHLPYSTCNLAPFENWRDGGMPYFIPSLKFIRELYEKGNYFYANFDNDSLESSIWYAPEHRDVFIYFDSWEDLKMKLNTHLAPLRKKIQAHALNHCKRMVDRWKCIFEWAKRGPFPSVVDVHPDKQPFVVGRLVGQLGNQFFIIAATMNVALENGAVAYFPDFISEETDSTFRLKENYKHVFSRFNAALPEGDIAYCYVEPNFTHCAIPFYPDMQMRGWYQSEKYFKKHKAEILRLFAPSEEVEGYLHAKYADIIDHPNTVSVHVRSYLKEDPQQKVYITLGMDYYTAAMAKFPKDALFVIFSPDIEGCKEKFSHLGRRVRFIEGEKHYHDLYLMSKCKHHIIANSSFSWWGAYLNGRLGKRVIAPGMWFSPCYLHDERDLIPAEWTRIPVQCSSERISTYK